MPAQERPIKAEFEKYCAPMEPVLSQETKTMLQGAFYGGAVAVFTMLMRDHNPPAIADSMVRDFEKFTLELESLERKESCPVVKLN